MIQSSKNRSVASLIGKPDLLIPVALLAVGACFVYALGFTPVERTQGEIQKIFYVHVPTAWVGMLAFISVGVAGVIYLFLRDERLDFFSASAVEAGLVFITLTLITGPLWGKPVWGAYWNWGDARLTSTLVLWLVYIAYLFMRSGIEDRQMRARYSAVLGIMGALLVPFVHVSVYMFNSAHPLPMLAATDVFTSERRIDGRMMLTALVTFAACLLLFIAFVRARYRLEVAHEQLLQREASDGAPEK